MKNMKLKAILALLLAVAVFMGMAGVSFAAEPDAGVKGLWLRSSNFPDDAEVVEFRDDPFPLDENLSNVSYSRSVDGLLTFEIFRGTIEDSELQGPDDVRDLIEMFVYDDGGDVDDIEIDMNPSVFSAHFTYPCVMAAYATGQNEDTRMNVSLYIFTDVYSFVATVSVAADWFEDYEDRIEEWLIGLEWVE